MSDIELRDACLSYRHDFGLMLKCEQDDLIYQAKEWSRCLRVDELKAQLATATAKIAELQGQIAKLGDCDDCEMNQPPRRQK